MKIRIQNFKKSKTQIYLFLLALLGFSSSCRNGCQRIIIDDTGVKYGVPQADYVIKGSVSDPSGKPITSGIQVTMLAYMDSTVAKDQNPNLDSLITRSDAEGRFAFNLHSTTFNQKYIVQFKDVDGNENGLYRSKDTTVNFDDVPFQKNDADDEWYSGEKAIEMKIKLDPEK